MLQRDQRGGGLLHSRGTSREQHLCQFCKNCYSRRDALQRHSIICPKRGPNPLPYFRRARGRARHACSTCASKKTSCDGGFPCSTCTRRGLYCLRPGSDSSPANTSTASSSKDSHLITHEARNDQVNKPSSIAFLLRDGEEEVFSPRFNFPRPAPRSPTASRGQVGVYLPTAGSTDASVAFDFDFINSIFEPSFLSADVWPGGDPSHLESWLDSPHTAHEEHDIYGVADSEAKLDVIVKSILCAPSVTHLDAAGQKSVEAQLKHLFAPARISRFLRYYFDCWHRNSQVVHKPSFSAAQVNGRLLAGVALLGAMYSPVEDERTMAGEIMCHAEEYIFLHERLSGERHVEEDRRSTAAQEGDFQTIQAGLCMLVIQVWTGNETARKRAMTLRFGQVIEAARASGLLQAKHQLEDRVSEATWLKKESMIRTATYLILQDCAFLFFKGISLRVPSSEIECDLPCEEAIFDASHPFTEPGFSFRRVANPNSAFRALFAGKVSTSLTMLDTFILVHMLYRYVSELLQLCLARQMMTAFTGMLAEADRALNTWHEQWEMLKEDAVRKDVWEKMGFWRNGDQYEAATRVLLSESARPHLSGLVKSHVDRLELLKRLTSGESAGLS